MADTTPSEGDGIASEESTSKPAVQEGNSRTISFTANGMALNEIAPKTDMDELVEYKVSTVDDEKPETVARPPTSGARSNTSNNTSGGLVAGPSSKAADDDDENPVYSFGSAEDAWKYAMAIDREPDLVAEADYVLGACSDEKCSYSEGYKKRQALYSCLTCAPESGGEPVGVCLACSLQCHDGHSLIELYCKRLFRCDCGNSKFSGFECKLIPQKEVTNDKNKYNDNFWGKYCFCKRPFPDPDISEEDNAKEEHAMHQCLVCEDWFHLKCMGVKTNQMYTNPATTSTLSGDSAETSLADAVGAANGGEPDDDHVVKIEDDSGHELEMLCTTCRTKHTFLDFYVKAFEQSVKSVSTSTGSYNADDVSSDTWWRDNVVRPATAAANGSVMPDPLFKMPVRVESCYLKRLHALFGDDADGKSAEKSAEISLANNLAAASGTGTGSSIKPAFFDDEWLRSYLCTCSDCVRMYVDQDVAYLLDPEDSYSAYYAKGMECKRKREAELEEMSEAESAKQLTKLVARRVNGGVDKPINPVVEVIMANAIGEFHRGFAEFANSQAEAGKTINGDDIRAFTEQLRKKLRGDMQKTTPSHNCG